MFANVLTKYLKNSLYDFTKNVNLIGNLHLKKYAMRVILYIKIDTQCVFVERGGVYDTK